ncbi:MAG: hypothetical protein AAF688_09835, partial [Bacteroidota bacterium]
GQFTDLVNFGGTSLESAIGSQDLFVWMLENDGSTQWVRHIKASENLTGAEVTTDLLDNLYFGLGISGNVEFQTGENEFESATSCGGQNCPILIQYTSNGDFGHYIQAQQTDNARFGELSFSKNTIFIDCVFSEGLHIIRDTSLQSQNGTKDAAIVAIELN